MSLPPKIVLFNSREGLRRFQAVKDKAMFYRLAPHFQPQRDPCHCAVAVAVIALNTMKLDERGDSVPYSQETLLSEATDPIRNRKTIQGPNPGFTASQLAKLLEHFGLNIVVNYEDIPESKGAVRLRKTLKKAFKKGGPLCLANFSYAPLMGEGGGHFSPLAAYHAPSDSVLVLDVANHKTLWYWAPTELLVKAMREVDKSANSPRGMLLVASHLN